MLQWIWSASCFHHMDSRSRICALSHGCHMASFFCVCCYAVYALVCSDSSLACVLFLLAGHQVFYMSLQCMYSHSCTSLLLPFLLQVCSSHWKRWFIVFCVTGIQSSHSGPLNIQFKGPLMVLSLRSCTYGRYRTFGFASVESALAVLFVILFRHPLTTCRGLSGGV